MKDREPAGHKQPLVSTQGNTVSPQGNTELMINQTVLDAEQLFREHARFVAGFLHRLGAADGELDDLVQEVFIIVHRKGGFVPQGAQPRSWLGAIAVRVASEARRAGGRRREVLNSDLHLDRAQANHSPEQDAETTEALQRVQHALAALDDDHRTVWVLFEIEGESAGAIAAALQIPVGTVYSRLHHARQRFAEAHAALARLDKPVTPTPIRLVEGT